MEKEEALKIFSLYKSFDTFFCDFFDTLVHWKNSPFNFFIRYADWIKQNCKVQGDIIKLAYSLQYIYKCDLSSRNNADNVRLHFCPWVNKHIFDSLTSDLFSRILKEEIDIDSNALWLLNKLKEENKRIVIVSDYYLEKDYLTSLLQNFGMSTLIDDLYVSSNYLTTKKHNLFDIVNKKEGVGLVIDDNKECCESAIQKGFSSFNIDSNYYKQKYNYFDTHYLELLRKVLQQNNDLKYSNKEKDASDYCYCIYLFCKKLYRELNNNDKVHFFAREGLFLKKAFDLFLTKNNDKNITTEYTIISRFALFLPILDTKKMTCESFCESYKKHAGLTIHSFARFFEILGFTIEETTNITDQLRIELQNSYDDIFDTKEFNSLFSCDLFIQSIQRRKKETYGYINNNFLSTNNRYVLIELGARGSIQNDLRHILPKDITLVGYYMGYGISYPGSKVVDEMNNSTKKGLLYDYGIGALSYYQVCFFGEPLLRANHGFCVGYTNNNPILIDDSSIQVYNYYSKYKQELMMEKIEKSMLLDSYTPIPDNILEEISCYSLNHLSHFEQEQLSFYHLYQKKEYNKNNDATFKYSVPSEKTVKKYIIAFTHPLKQIKKVIKRIMRI